MAPGRQRRERRGPNAWPLGLQLSALYAGLLAFVLAALGLALYLQLDHFLVQDAATRLEGSARPLLRRVFSPPPRGGPAGKPAPVDLARTAPDLVRSLASREVAVAVLGGDGAVLSASAPADAGPAVAPGVPAALAGQALASGGYERVDTVPGGARVLTVLIPLAEAGSAPGRVPDGLLEQVTVLAAADALLDQLRLYLLLGLIAGLTLGLGAGLPLTRRLLRPLDRLGLVASAIAAGDLARRVGLPPGESEIRRLGQAFDGMVDRLVQALEAQRRFVADAAHELRTPLAALAGMNELLLRGADRNDAATRYRILGTMQNELERLARLVGDLLALSRAGQPAELRLVPIDAAALLAEVAAQMTPLAAAHDIRLLAEAGCSDQISADLDRLRQVLLNLVDNALRFTPAGGAVWVRVGPAVGGGVEYQVQDSGPGLSPGDLPHLFERFYRGDVSRSRATGGSGLGLAISQALVEAHGGRIAVASPPGAGATFSVTLPGLASEVHLPVPPRAA